MLFIHFHSQWVLRLTTLEGKEYLIGAPDQATRDEWYLAIEKRILRLDPSKVGKMGLSECARCLQSISIRNISLIINTYVHLCETDCFLLG